MLLRYDDLVIGGGVSGLTTAVLLAQTGRSVAIIEKAPRLAPLISGFHRKKLYFDTGLHYLGGCRKNRIFDILTRFLKIDTAFDTIQLNPEGFELLHINDLHFEARVPSGFSSIRSYLKSLFPADKEAVDAFFDKIEVVNDLLLDFKFHELLSSLASTHKELNVSLTDFVGRLTQEPSLKAVLTAHCMLHGSRPNETSMLYHSLVVGSYFESAHRVKGGGMALVKAFRERLNALGVDIFCGEGVDRLVFSKASKLHAVQLADGAVLEGQNVVSTIHPISFLHLVPEGVFRPVFVNRLQKLAETPSAYLFFAKYDGFFPDHLPEHLFAVPQPGYFDFGLDKPVDQRPIFIVSDRHSSQNDQTPISIIIPAVIQEVQNWRQSTFGERPKTYDQFKAQLTQQVGQEIGKRFPELCERLTFVDAATPLTLKDYSHNPFGSMYGVKHCIGQYNPGPRTKIENLFLAGQSIAAPGILGAMTSAFLTVRFLLREDTITKGLEVLKNSGPDH